MTDKEKNKKPAPQQAAPGPAEAGAGGENFTKSLLTTGREVCYSVKQYSKMQ